MLSCLPCAYAPVATLAQGKPGGLVLELALLVSAATCPLRRPVGLRREGACNDRLLGHPVGCLLDLCGARPVGWSLQRASGRRGRRLDRG